MEIPDHLERLSVDEIKVVTDVKCQAGYVGAPDGSVYDTPMVTMFVDWATPLMNLTTDPITSKFMIEPGHALEIAQALGQMAISALTAGLNQEGRPNT